MKNLILTLFCTLSVSILIGATVTNETPDDATEVSYPYPVSTFSGMQKAIDGGVAYLAKPNPNAYTEEYGYTFDPTTTNYVASVTNVVRVSEFAPLSWDTTTWPVADVNGVPLTCLIVTNPPTITVSGESTVTTNQIIADTYVTGEVSGVSITLTNATYADVVLDNTAVTRSVSQVWVNTSSGSLGKQRTNHWKMVR